MNRTAIGGLLLAAGLALAPAASAQRAPHIGYVYPAGGRQGTTFVVTLGGQSLEGVTNAFVSGPGVSAELLNYERQVTPKEQDQLVKELSQLRGKRQQGGGLSDAEENRADEIRTTLTRFGRQLVNPALNQFVTLRVAIARDANVGRREIRLLTAVGLSNPLVFCVGDMPELSKPDWKNVPKSKESTEPQIDPSPSERRIAPPIVLNGQLQPGGIDRYRFAAKRGQMLTVIASARDLLPYLPDAVPGWFQAALTLYDASGKELQYDDDFRFHPDPVLFFRIPSDGDYVLEIRDSLHRGREDFVYRIAVGELPFVTVIFPLGGGTGGQCTVAVSGWNLPQNSMTLDLKNQPPGLYPFLVRGAGRPSNRVPFAVDTLPEYLEAGDCSPASAQPVALPVIVNGRIEQPGDEDAFRFEGHAGQRVVAEVLARRLDSPLDSFLNLTDAAGRQWASNDDHEDKGSGLDTHHADSYLAATLPSNGAWFVRIGDTQHKGGAAYTYRLRLSAPRPDFELRATPSSINARGGTSVPITIHTLRKDGFAGEILLALKGAPEGFALAGARVPAGQDKVKITLSVPPRAGDGPLNLHLECRVRIEGRDVVRAVVPADELVQAFSYRQLVPAQEMKVAVWGKFMAHVPGRILSATPLRIPAGGTAQLAVSLPTAPQMGKVEYELFDPPDGIAIQGVATDRGNPEITLEADTSKVRPGLEGNLIIQAFAEHSPESNSDDPNAKKRRVPLGALPAVPFEVIAR